MLKAQCDVPNPDLDIVLWPDLRHLGLTKMAVSERRNAIGGSDANAIASGDRDRIRDLWLEKTGAADAPDLSDSLPVMLGCWTEAFNRQWFERITAQSISRIGHNLQCSERSWRRCTLDGFVESSQAVWEAKHTNAFSTTDEIVARYMPQLQHNMAVAKVETAFLSVIFGNHKFEIIEIAADWLYQLELLELEEQFWVCVKSGREPAAAPIPPPPKPVGYREVCLEGNNLWAVAAANWRDNREAAKIHCEAVKTLKGLVDDDVVRAFGHGIEAKRGRSGAVTIRELSA